METFGQALKALRVAAGLSQTELARAALWSQSQVSRAENDQFRPAEAIVDRIDVLLDARGRLVSAFRRVREPGRDGWEIREFMRHTHRTDVGKETIEQLETATEQLCCEYAWRDVEELRDDARELLRYVGRLVDGPCTLGEHRDLLVLAGWLTLLIGCLEYDLGRVGPADHARVAARSLGRETGHGEIVAWSFELSAWFSLTHGRLRSVSEYTAAGSDAAPNSSVVVQLAAQSAKAHARMGLRGEVDQILDRGFRLLARHEHPTRPENHFVIDPTKWDFYAMDCYRLLGDDRRAAEHAHEVISLSRRPDGGERSPMRATEARFTLAVTALRAGDLEAAAAWTRAALDQPRRSVAPLSM
ncbi:helix-turn-helix transcriptional regulator, partial [Actinophytocola sp.]|uniref:helix-turn-helix domain-containing protein n=1 Tax=Actinophytocola sp. TaxID=1872138 RepID=UPI002D7F9F23